MADSRQFDTSMSPFSSSALRVTSTELIQHSWTFRLMRCSLSIGKGPS